MGKHRTNELYVCPNLQDRAPVATVHVKKLNGASQSSLVATGDGTLYAVKFLEFVGQLGLVNEVVGSELMAGMGLPVPQWKPILLTEDFIRRHPKMWYRDTPESKGFRPEGGLAFGARVTVSKGRNQTYEILPSSWAERIVNRDDFVGALLFDLWANNCDRRQCVFLTDDHGKTLRALFVDNDQLFGGRFANENTCPRRTIVRNPEIYRGTWNEESVSRWRKKIDQIDDALIDRVLAGIPVEWAAQSAIKFVATELRLRRRKLGLLIDDVEDVVADGNFHLPALPVS